MPERGETGALSGRVLVYYFAFPRYRREILRGLNKAIPDRVDFVSGSTSRANIVALDDGDVEGLTVVPSLRLGPVSWDRGVFSRAVGRRYSAVILGPATLSLTTWCILVARRLRGRRTFLWGQCGKFGDRSLKRRIQEVMNRLATGLLVYGENEAVAATQFGLARERVHVVNNATRSNSDVIAAADGQRQFARVVEAADAARALGEVRLLFVGRVNRDKHVAVLLEAADRLRSSAYPQLSIDVIGDGDAKEELRAAYPHPWARFHGWVYEEERLDDYFSGATLVCSAYDMGLVAIDALRAGTPVLIPDNPRNGPEVEALTPGVNAMRFVPGDSDSLAASVVSWIDGAQHIDADRYRDARTDALSVWDPDVVATGISRVVRS
jgi:glycosyltransferase involved in cell wall biosynthesis